MRCAIANPIPETPPVTTHTRPARSNLFIAGLLVLFGGF
jgi:hypothetical protein